MNCDLSPDQPTCAAGNQSSQRLAIGELESSDAIVVLPDGEMREADGADGMVFSSGKLLSNLRHAREAWGEEGAPCHVDGTFKVHRGNFVLILCGTTTLRKDARNKVVRSLRPWAGGLFPSESEVSVYAFKIQYSFCPACLRWPLIMCIRNPNKPCC